MVLSIQYILSQWEAWGVFDFVLPFLLIFAVVFGILTATGWIGNNKGVSVIISFVVAAMAIRTGLVQNFFVNIFPQVGVGLAVIVALVILTGLFIPNDEARWWAYGFAIIGVIIWIISVSGSFAWFSFTQIEDYVPLILGGILLVGLIIAVATSGRAGKNKAPAEFKLIRE
jgi:hypothetical protein